MMRAFAANLPCGCCFVDGACMERKKGVVSSFNKRRIPALAVPERNSVSGRAPVEGSDGCHDTTSPKHHSGQLFPLLFRRNSWCNMGTTSDGDNVRRGQRHDFGSSWTSPVAKWREQGWKRRRECVPDYCFNNSNNNNYYSFVVLSSCILISRQLGTATSYKIYGVFLRNVSYMQKPDCCPAACI